MEGGLHHKSNLCFLCADALPSYTSLLTNKLCTNRSFVCQTLAWLREPACSGVGLTIDITVLPELSVCFLHGSLSLSPSILELTVRLVARLISHSLRGMFGLWSAKQTRAFKSPREFIEEFGRLRTKKGLQGGKTIQQRSEFFASLVPNASTSSLAHALVHSLHTCMCVYYSESTQLSVVLLLRSWDP